MLTRACADNHYFLMPIIGFQQRFADLVEHGQKRQTIRKYRKHNPKTGDILYLYTGLRTKRARKIGERVCTRTANFEITASGKLKLDRIRILNTAEFAIADGFESKTDMVRWFEETHGLPFAGILIEWE